MRRTTAILAAALLAGTTACTSSDDSDPKPSASSGISLAAKYAPRLLEANTAESAVCNQVGDQACATHLTDIAMVVTDLELEIEEAGGADAYPRATDQIEQINAAVDAYTEHECLGDENAGIAGSPCPDDARTIMTGGAALQPALEADEAKNG